MTYFRVRYCSYCEYWQYVILRYCPYCVYTRSFSYYVRLYCLNSEYCDTAVLPVLAEIWEDTASIGNILGLCTADMLLPLWAVLAWPLAIIPRVYSYHSYFPAQLVGGFTLSDHLDKPWSQVSSLPPGMCLQFLSRIGFSIPTARRF